MRQGRNLLKLGSDIRLFIDRDRLGRDVQMIQKVLRERTQGLAAGRDHSNRALLLWQRYTHFLEAKPFTGEIQKRSRQ